ncbi:MAG: C-GCAxxG-C-C family protein [bacterium]
MDKVESTVSCFKEGFSCSQALLSTYGVDFGLNREMALKVSGAFGGGMGRMGEICGAVTGAFMVIGLKYGKTRVEDEQTKEKTYSLVREFVDKFKSRNRSIACRELLGCEISTPEGMKIAKEKNLIATLCPKFVQDASEIIEQILK